MLIFFALLKLSSMSESTSSFLPGLTLFLSFELGMHVQMYQVIYQIHLPKEASSRAF